MTETSRTPPASGTDGLSAGRRVRLGLITAALAVFFLAVFAIYTWAQLHPEFAGEPLVVKVWFFVAAELTLACGVYCALQSLEIWVGPGTRVTAWALLPRFADDSEARRRAARSAGHRAGGANPE